MTARVMGTITDETLLELDEFAAKLAMSRSQLLGICIAAGLQVIKLAMDPSYEPIMKAAQEKVDRAIDEAQAGRPANRKGSGRSPG